MVRNYYEILDISKVLFDTPTDSATVKRAYRRALLRYHPDKIVAEKELETVKTSASKDDIPTVDEITLAYQILSDAKTRLEYNRQLRLLHEDETTVGEIVSRSVGLETIDLDDMDYDEAQALWIRACRCGTADGFALTEDDLEKAIEGIGGGNSHEILVGCSGCSLSLKVKFAVAEEV